MPPTASLETMTRAPKLIARWSIGLLAFWVVWLGAASAGADVPFGKIYLDNAVEVQNQEAFPGWMVVVFPSAPPSGRPAAWPALVEPGFQTQIDRSVLGKPKLWLLPTSELPALEAASRENDNQLDGPVWKLLHDKGVECLELELVWSGDFPLTAPNRRVSTFRLDAASEASCKLSKVTADLTSDEFKRGPRWAAFAPKKKPNSDASASAVVSAAPSAPAASAVAAPPAASASAPPSPPASAKGTPTDAPASAAPRSGCGCGIVGSPGEAPAALIVLIALVSRRRRHA